MKLTRRAFIRTTGTLAAGAAAGVMASRGLREYGPVELRTYFLSQNPIVIRSMLFSRESLDEFGVHIFDDDGKKAGTVRMSLSGMRRIIKSGSGREEVICHSEKCMRTESMRMAVVSEQGKVSFLVDEAGNPPTPVWLQLEDVRKVL